MARTVEQYEARHEIADLLDAVRDDPKRSDLMVGLLIMENLDTVLAALRAQPERAAEEDEQAARRIVSARLAADTDGHGSVDITLKGGRRVLLSLDVPHQPEADGVADG